MHEGMRSHNILVDVNIFEDVFRARRGWRASEALLLMVRQGKVRGFVSALTPVILYYFRSQRHMEAEARRLTHTILDGFQVVDLTAEIITASYASRLPDFEDAVHYESARVAHATHLITRNLTDYPDTEIPAVMPETFLRLLRAH